MFDNLCGHEPAERAVRHRFEMLQRIGFGDLEPALASDGDHFVVRIHARGADAFGLKQREKLAAAGADVEHIRGAGKHREVRTELGANVLVGAAEPVLESDVLVIVQRLVGARR